MTLSLRRALSLSLLCGLGAFVPACGQPAESRPAAAAPAPVTITSGVLLAQHCPELRRLGEASRAPARSLFVEIAEAPPGVTPTPEGLRKPLDVRRVGGLLLKNEDAVSLPSDTSGGQMTVQARQLPSGIDAKASIAIAPASGGSKTLSLALSHEEPSLVSLGATSLIVTPYFLFEPVDDGLRALKACRESAGRR